MRAITLMILALHSLIHLPGFLQAFGIASFDALTLTIGRGAGLAWFAVALLLFASVLAGAMRLPGWWILAASGLLFSQVLIVTFWGDAKYGTVVNVVASLLLVLTVARQRFDTAVAEGETSVLRASSERADLTLRSVNTLPEPVRRWLNRSGALDRTDIRSASLRQELLLRLKPTQREWYPAIATQVLTVSPPAFHWAVSVKMNPLLQVYGRDGLEGEQARLRMSLWGVWPVTDVKRNPKVNEAAVQRYLSEIAWLPISALSPAIAWEPVDDTSARATMTIGTVTGTGIFHFNPAGDFTRFEALRYKDSGPDARRIPWIAQADDWAVFDGLRVPARLHATWELDEEDWTWIKIEVTDLHYGTTGQVDLKAASDRAYSTN